ncbi:MAG: hypothetical protein H7Y18_16380 [Clostridiaceae bacterium]|nr:hypothetical protein [Clostridiaceae bacterium]
MRNNSFLILEFIENINKQLIEIKLTSREAETINKVTDLMEYVKIYYDKSDSARENLALCIENSMKQARHNNSEMDAMLYIVHKDLINSRISVEKARELYEQYLKVELYEKNKF